VSAHAEAIITAGLRPDLFSSSAVVFRSRTLLLTGLAVLVLLGFGFRVSGLSVEGLGEDELNKLHAVADYRVNGLTSINGEHPLLMKGLQTASILVCEKWNQFLAPNSEFYIQPETALRLPGVILGALTAILIYLVAAELFGSEVGLIAAALWAFDPNAIGFNRVAKEDSFLLFFFILANVFWLRGQRVAESQPNRNPAPFYWATAAAFGAMMASKYVPHLIGISISYYWMFQNLPETRWRLGKRRMLTFFAIMGVAFLILNPAILLPETWRQMGLFAGGKRISHDAYEFMGQLFKHKWSDWLQGTPWYFFLVFTWVKLPLLTLAGLLVGLPLLFRRKLGDGRYFILFWLFFFFAIFSFLGGKFTRYYTVVLPAVLITAALGIQWAGQWLAAKLNSRFRSRAIQYIPTITVLLVVFASIEASASAKPYYRMHLNRLGGGTGNAGFYFPHDEFYDTSMRQVMAEISLRARSGARVASESPSLATYYAGRANRFDLVNVSLSDRQALPELGVGDYLIAARGRRYFSNDEIVKALRKSGPAEVRIYAGTTPSVEVYRLDEQSLIAIHALTKRE